MASPSTVISLGYGSFGSVNLLPTLGYGVGSVAEDTTPVFRYRNYPSLPTVRPSAQPTSATVRWRDATSTTVRPR